MHPKLWHDPEKARGLNKERSQLTDLVTEFDDLTQSLRDTQEFLELTSEQDTVTLDLLHADLQKIEKQIARLEFNQMFPHPEDILPAYLDIQSGSGGTDAQDWANMLLRMYLRWGEQHQFKTEIIDLSEGEIAGIKNATIHFSGPYAYGWLRTETGVHRLVRPSPFDSNARRHTSFASVFVYPEIDDDISIEINPADLRIDTYRASGAGGQHVQKTDSAVRMTHIPTNIIVQCQSDRSQHRNRMQAMKQLRAKLYELELRKRRQAKQNLEQQKRAIGWGSQIRSYVLDDGRIKDLRTQVESGHVQAVLDGSIDLFLIASLKAGI
jgi:peptide chain release factor 2